MANKMLGKVVAGAALGGASLLVFAPGVAFADGHPDTDEGKVFAKPHAVKAGEEVKLVQVCPEPQEHPFVWSKVTGKVKLKPADKGKDRGSWGEEGGSDESGKDWADRNGSKDWENGDSGEDWKGGERPQPAYGAGGGAADGGHDWKGEEHAQDAEGAADHKDDKAPKDDWKGHEGEKRDWADEESEGGWSGEKSEDGWSGEKSEDGWSGEKSEDGWSGEKSEDGWSGEKSEGGWSGEKSEGGWSGEKSEGGWSGEESEGGWSGEKRDWADEESGKGDSWEHEKDFVYYGEARVAKDAKPGTYELEGSCGTGELVVLPHGGVDGGDGGVATGTDRGLATAGAGLVGAAALGGLVLMRRRRVDEFAA